MPFVMFTLWTISTGLIMFDGKNEKTRWVAFIAFCGGFGALAESIKDNFIPYLVESQSLTPALDSFLRSAFNISCVLNHILGAYAMFGATIVYCELFIRQTVVRLKLLLLVTVFITITVSDIFPVVDINWNVLASWAVPYIFIGTGFLVRAYQLEGNPKRKKDRMIVLLAVSGPTVTVAFTDHLIDWHYESCVPGRADAFSKAAEKAVVSSGSRSASVGQPCAFACLTSSSTVFLDT